MGGEPARNGHGQLTPDAQRFLTTLEAFCFARQSCVVVGKDGHVDTYGTAIAEGRREVFIEIQRVMNITDAELFALRNPDDEETPS